jgi:ribosomal protein L24E
MFKGAIGMAKKSTFFGVGRTVLQFLRGGADPRRLKWVRHSQRDAP